MSLRDRIFNAAYYVAVMALAFALVNWFQGTGFLLKGDDFPALVFLAIGLFQGMKVGAEWKE